MHGFIEAVVSLLVMRLGQIGQDHGRQCDTEYAQWEFEQAVRVIEPGDAAGDQKGRNKGIEQQVDLRHGRTEQRGDHQFDNFLYAVVLPAPLRSRQQSRTIQEWQLKQQLCNACDQYSPGQCRHRHIQTWAQPQRATNHAQVEQNRGEGRYREAFQGIQDTAGHRRHGDQQYVGEGDA